VHRLVYLDMVGGGQVRELIQTAYGVADPRVRDGSRLVGLGRGNVVRRGCGLRTLVVLWLSHVVV
jgi:hypothetical protein